MPFDATPVHPRAAEIEIVNRMRELLATPDKWCQSALENDDGQMCVVGAFGMAARGDSSVARCIFDDGTPISHLWFALNSDAEVTDYPGVMFWNDAPQRTHAEVLDLLVRVRRRFEGE